jgi:hypothetical protein
VAETTGRNLFILKPGRVFGERQPLPQSVAEHELNTATAMFFCSSSSVKTRPISVLTPSTYQKFPIAFSAGITSGPESPDSAARVGEREAMIEDKRHARLVMGQRTEPSTSACFSISEGSLAWYESSRFPQCDRPREAFRRLSPEAVQSAGATHAGVPEQALATVRRHCSLKAAQIDRARAFRMAFGFIKESYGIRGSQTNTA